MRLIIIQFLLFCAATVTAQALKPIGHADVHRWRKIEQTRISNNGQWVAWVQTPVTEGDATLQLWNAATKKTQVFSRAVEPQFSFDNQLLIFKIKPALDTLKAQRRQIQHLAVIHARNHHHV